MRTIGFNAEASDRSKDTRGEENVSPVPAHGQINPDKFRVKGYMGQITPEDIEQARLRREAKENPTKRDRFMRALFIFTEGVERLPDSEHQFLLPIEALKSPTVEEFISVMNSVIDELSKDVLTHGELIGLCRDFVNAIKDNKEQVQPVIVKGFSAED